MGESTVVRYSTLFLPKNRSGSGRDSQRTLSLQISTHAISFTAKLSYRNPIILTNICIIACDHTHKKLFVVLIRSRCFIEKELFCGVAVGMYLHAPVKFKIIDSENTGNDVFLRIGFSHTPKGFLLLTNQIIDQCIPAGSDPDFL
jgi:hypothetical protein